MFFTLMAGAPSIASDLIDALKKQDVAQVRTLLAAGADVNQKVRGDYPLNIAATFGPVEAAASLIEAGADIEKSGRDGFRPLQNATISGRKDIVALLIQKGAMVDATENRGRTALVSFAATGGSNMEIAAMLLAAGADPNKASAPIDDSYSALHYVAETGNLELGKLLIAADANVNFINPDGDAPIHFGIETNRLEVVRLLIANGADVNLVNRRGQSTLFIAGRNPEMQKLLMDAGAK
jgi:ankyrin repeat protein